MKKLENHGASGGGAYCLNFFYKGFTLAEVLITLGIIGVVAALTIPNLIVSHRKNVLATRLAKLYSSLNQAMVRAQSDNGECQYWDFGDINNHRDANIMKLWWNKYFENYIPNVVHSEIDASENSGNGGYKVYFKDGSALRIEALTGTYARIILYPNAKITGKFLIDINDKAGKDYFMFLVERRNTNCVIRPAVSNIDLMTEDDLKEKCLQDYNTFISTNSSGGACAELIMRNGWKIPNDYPIKL